MDPIVDSILSSFRRIPPAAIPAMLDCIFVSTAAMPSSLFSDLLKEFPKIMKGTAHKSETMESEWRNVVVSYVSALCHCLKKSDTYYMHFFLRDVLMPVLKLVHTHDHELFNEVTILFLSVVTESNSWEILEASMVPFLLKSIAVSIGMLQTDELIYQWRETSTSNVYLDDDLIGKSFDNFPGKLIDNCLCQDLLGFSSHDFPLPVSCNILTLILNTSLPNKLKIVDPLSILENGSRAKVLAGKVLWDMTNLTTLMVLESVEHRSAAIRYLLPSICKAFTCHCKFEVVVAGIEHILTRMDFLRKIWKCCKLLFSLGSLERRDAYDMLSLCLSFSFVADKDVTVGESLTTFDLKADQEFWDEIKRGLLDKESLVRKQSVHILRTSLNLSKQCVMGEEVPEDGGFVSGVMNKRGRWAQEEAKSLGVGRICKDNEPIFIGQFRWVAFLFLYEMLEEYGTHLVEAAWNHQMTLWLRSALASESSIQSLNQNLHHNHMATAAQIFEWLSVLWERGFCHDNPQVRFLIMHSFLAIEWENYAGFAKLVPKEFILGPLIQGLNDPVHHREFGVKETYSSSAIEAATRFFYQYACCIEERYSISFLVDLSSAPKTYSFGRVGLMCLVECICAAAYGYSKHNSHEIEQVIDATANDNVVATTRSSLPNNRAQLLDVLRFVLECSKQHFNPKYRHKVCERILSASTSLMTASDVPLEALLHFISSLPLDYTDNGGLLRNVVKAWLHNNFQLLKAIEGFTENFICLQHPKDSFFSYDDEELDAWGSEAKRWARVLFLLVDGQEQEFIDPILEIIRSHGRNVCQQKNYFGMVLVKFLILVSSLVEELEMIQARRSYSQLKRRLNTEINAHRMLDDRSFMEEQVIGQWAELLFSFMEELVSFAKLSCSVFWKEMPQNMTLPSVVRGKLGGPSQRRLPSSLCTSVLESITSVKLLASVLRWCTHFRTSDQTNSVQTFLWKFCWNVIRSAVPKSEIEAEICIAAYEACAHALRDLVYVFSPLSLDLVADGDKLLLEAKGKAPFDVFVSTFIENINKVIDGGNLVRTRRAVLMNWKWICLESLLSIPFHARCNEDLSRMCKYYYSNSIISLTLSDLVGSLENAGEASALPMLRSVRLSIELLASRIIDTAIVSSGGLTMEMIWRLVHASWILHVSCNKRRVAPLAALLSAVLHYSVFGDDCMHEFNNVPGPLKWFVEKVLEEGSKSPRTIRLAALHLCGLWLAYPNTIKYYIRELKLLTFYGSVAFDEDFEAELAETYDAKAEVSGLSKSLDPELTDVFINTELYARVSVAVLFSKLANMADGRNPTVKVEDRVAAISSGKIFLLELFDTVVNDKDLSKELYKKYSAIHRRKVRAWQMICALSRFVDLEILEEVTSNLHKSICRNNLPSVRQYLETLAIFIYMKFPSLVGQQLVPQLRNYDLRSQALSSYVFISANVILHAQKETRSAHLDELLPPILPLLTSHHHTLRGFTQILVYHVLQKLLSDPVSSTMSLERRCFVDLRYYLASNSDCARLRSSMDHHISSFDPVKSISPAGIFTDRIDDLEFECVPATLMDRVIDFLNDTREDLRSSMAKDVAAIKNESIHINEPKKYGEMVSSQDQSVMLLQKELMQDFQRKITFSHSELQDTTSTFFLEEKPMFGSLSDMENEDMLVDRLLHSRGLIVQKLKAGRQQFILLASLVDRIPNLAGLARTCEVFRAAGLAVADKNILNDKQFQLISVTAEKWVPILEVPVDSMKSFLEKKKQEGFAILGLEQTANSISLDQYNFPTKTVLVLGREKEGIPVEIIHILDACIEIPQLGVVRSLNVHVSGAIALWEYTRQQRSS